MASPGSTLPPVKGRSPIPAGGGGDPDCHRRPGLAPPLDAVRCRPRVGAARDREGGRELAVAVGVVLPSGTGLLGLGPGSWPRGWPARARRPGWAAAQRRRRPLRVKVTVAPGSAPSPEQVKLSPGETVDSDTVRLSLLGGYFFWTGRAPEPRTSSDRLQRQTRKQISACRNSSLSTGTYGPPLAAAGAAPPPGSGTRPRHLTAGPSSRQVRFCQTVRFT